MKGSTRRQYLASALAGGAIVAADGSGLAADTGGIAAIMLKATANIL
ncbi:MAG: hypothetical protein ACREB1_03915 [Sphingomicrobium sp.]